MHFEIYEAMKRAFLFFFGHALLVTFGMQDHSDAAYNAKRRAWPGIIINNCYPHASRMVTRATRERLRDRDGNAARIRQAFRLLQGLTIDSIFEHAMMLFYLLWETSEPAFVEWFRTTYDANGRWLGWFAGEKISNSFVIF